MRISRIKRALKEIRISNHIKKGGVIKQWCKVNADLDEKTMFNSAKEAVIPVRFFTERLNRKFANKMVMTDVDMGYEDDDFAKKLMTFVFSFKLKTE